MTNGNQHLFRTRWAAIGAAVAITLGAGGIGITQALTEPAERASYQPIEPCRILDTRPDTQVGPRSTPLAGDETYSVDGAGNVGDCDLADGLAALELNVTAVSATTATFLTIFPTGTDRPNASSLNPAPGQPPTPNSVTAKLGTGSQFDIYNLAGTVDVIVDVVGVYERLSAAVVAGNGVTSGGWCTGNGLEFFTADAAGAPVDGRFSFLIPGYGLGLIDDDGTVLNGPAAVGGATVSAERVAPGQYCITYTGTQPGPNIAASALASIAVDD